MPNLSMCMCYLWTPSSYDMDEFAIWCQGKIQSLFSEKDFTIDGLLEVGRTA